MTEYQPGYTGSYALIIGINDYEDPRFVPLGQAEEDAKKLAAVLAAPPHKFQVKLLLGSEATREAILQAMFSLRDTRPDDRILLYFAGHGYTLTDNFGEETGFLAAADTIPEQDFTALELEEVTDLSRHAEAKHVAFIFDACFSGQALGLTRAQTTTVEKYTTRRAYQVISAGAGDQTVSDYESMTDILLDALTMDLSGPDGVFTFSDLGLYLQQTVAANSRQTQIPQYGHVQGSQGGDMVFDLAPGAVRPTESHVFISYSHENGAFVDKLVADLNAYGVKTWRDQDMIPGHLASNTASWRRAVDEGLRQADVMVVVLSPEAVASQEVEAEWNYFLTHRRPVYPVLYRDCDIPYRLMALQIWDLRTNYRGMVADLAARLAGEVPASHTGPSSLPHARRTSPRLPVWGWVGGAVILTALLVAGLLGVFSPGGDETPTPTVTKSIGGPTIVPVDKDATSTGEPVAEATVTTAPTPSGVIVEADARGVEMARIPPGTFTMGFDTDLAFIICEGTVGDCTTDQFEDEEPIHTVTLTSSYWIDLTEVTNGQYAECVEAGVCDPPVETGSATRTSYFNNLAFKNYPVIYVTWEMADTFCQEWRGGRLPTEAEWEYAARGQNDWIYPWGNRTVAPNLLNFCDAGCPFDWADPRAEDGYPGDTAPVGSFEDGASPFGLLDMAGNVWEWVDDWYSIYPASSVTDPTGPTSWDGRTGKVRRGGSWNNSAGIVRIANRGWNVPDRTDNDQGFRCARTP